MLPSWDVLGSWQQLAKDPSCNTSDPYQMFITAKADASSADFRHWRGDIRRSSCSRNAKQETSLFYSILQSVLFQILQRHGPDIPHSRIPLGPGITHQAHLCEPPSSDAANTLRDFSSHTPKQCRGSPSL